MSEEIRVTDPASGGQKGMKPERMGLLPWDALRAISRTYHYGATKYDDPVAGPHNWRRGYAWSLSYDALQRHLALWWDGEDLDGESGLAHLLHAGWHVLTLVWFTLHKPEHDDRPHTYPRAAIAPRPPATPLVTTVHRARGPLIDLLVDVPSVTLARPGVPNFFTPPTPSFVCERVPPGDARVAVPQGDGADA